MKKSASAGPGHNPGRREFLRTGISIGAGASLALTVFSTSTMLTACGKTTIAAAEGFTSLRPAHISMLEKLFPVMLPDNTGDIDTNRLLHNIDEFIHFTSPQNNKNILQLMDMLSTGFTRVLFLRRLGSWQDFSEQEAGDILTRMKTSSIGMLRLVYRTLISIVLMHGYYSEPETWPAIGYPGPPRNIV